MSDWWLPSSRSSLSAQIHPYLLPSYWLLSFLLHQSQQYIFTPCTIFHNGHTKKGPHTNASEHFSLFSSFLTFPPSWLEKKAVRKVTSDHRCYSNTDFSLENRNLLISLMTPSHPVYWRSNPGSHIYEINALPLSSVSSSLVKYHETSSQIKGIRKKNTLRNENIFSE